MTTPFEKQYKDLFKTIKNNGHLNLGLMLNDTWFRDPKRLLFVLSRYKFVAKMLQGKNKVLEIGASDGWASRIVAQHVKQLVCTDIDPVFIEYANKNKFVNDIYNVQYKLLDVFDDQNNIGMCDGIYLLDVLEHIDKKIEDLFLKKITQRLKKDGVLIIGTPSITSQKYASKQSKIGHVNCKSYSELKEFCEKRFSNVLIFSMNDEIVHTGFDKMANYFFAVCSTRL